MDDEFTEIESEETGYVSGRTQGFEIGPVRFIDLVKGRYLTQPVPGDITVTVFPPQLDAESGIYRYGKVRSEVFREDYDEPYSMTLALELTDEALEELSDVIGMALVGGPMERYDVEVIAMERGIPLPLDAFRVRYSDALTVTRRQADTLSGYLEELQGYWPKFL